MDRRKFMEASAALSVGGLSGSAMPEKRDPATLPSPTPLPFHDQDSKLRITGVRMVHTRPKKPLPRYEPAPGSWSTGGALVANPMSIYPKYRSEEHTSELQSRLHLVCRLLL